ncbi:MAG: Lrp/AsnC family transcriptional regulator [Parachlamydia sp.]|nr:Lrp/AsnC family transcriptional regulator [Parachlamydia sp.]
MIDALDSKIISRLVHQGRITWSELAGLLQLSAPSTAERVKRLEEKGIIKGYSARLDYAALGYGLTAFVAVTLGHPKHRTGFLKRVEATSNIEECHHIAGDDDYLLKVRCRTTQHLDAFLNESLKIIPGVLRTRTTIVLASPKETVADV